MLTNQKFNKSEKIIIIVVLNFKLFGNRFIKTKIFILLT